MKEVVEMGRGPSGFLMSSSSRLHLAREGDQNGAGEGGGGAHEAAPADVVAGSIVHDVHAAPVPRLPPADPAALYRLPRRNLGTARSATHLGLAGPAVETCIRPLGTAAFGSAFQSIWRDGPGCVYSRVS